MSDAIDYTALNWVRQELSGKLAEARRCLEAFIEAPANPQHLQECRGSLHQARGALQMVELQGADQLAAQMERVVDALAEERIMPAAAAAAVEVLIQAFIQLPGYLSTLSRGRREAPAVLLPIINRLREVCGEEPLTGGAIFRPDLTMPVPGACFNSQPHANLPDVQELAHTDRQRYQTGLVEWYRGGMNNSGLHKLYEVLANLQRASRCESVARLWWFGAGLAEALMRGALPLSDDIKQLFGRIDRQIKRLIDVGETAFSGSIPEDLLEQLLFQILRAETAAGRVGDIREIYAPHESDRRAAEGGVAGCDAELFGGVAAMAGERLEDIKSRLDGFLRAGVAESPDLAVIANDMHALGNTVGMIGLEATSRRLAEQELLLRMLLDGEQPVQESTLMPIANALLSVEAALREVSYGAAPPAKEGTPRDISYREGFGAAVREITASLTGARERIDDYVRTPAARDVLAEVPLLLDQVRGGLLLAGEERAAALVLQLCAYASQELIAGSRIPDERQLNTFADAICSIEHYVENLRRGSHIGRPLDVAAQSLGSLGYSPLPAGAQAPLEPSGAAAVSTAAVPPPGQAPVITSLQVIAAGVDGEILDIFLEEAAGEIALLAEHIPRAIVDTGDGEALETIRRAFHTLKGSGRMVGALALGEFAWVFERLTKQLADGTGGSGAGQRAFLAQAIDPLLQLLEQIKGGAAPQTDVNGLVMQAMNLMASGMAASTPVTGQADTGVNPVADGEVADDAQATLPELEDLSVAIGGDESELLDIFARECRDHLDSLRSFIEGCGRGEMACHVSEPLYRALHTLAGIAESAQISFIGELAGELYLYFATLVEAQQPLGREALEVLKACTAAMSEFVGRLPDRSFEGAVLHSLQEGIRGLPQVVVPEEPPMTEEPVPLIREETPLVAAGSDVPAPSLSETKEKGAIEPDAAASAAPSGDTDLYADVDPELFEVFLEEATEIIERSETTLHAWVADPGQRELMNEFQRQLHTLKGGARMVDVSAIGNLSHGVESLLTRLAEGRVETSEALFGLLRQAHDRLADMLDKVRVREVPEGAQALEEELGRLGVAEATVAAPLALVVDEPEPGAVTQTRQAHDLPPGGNRPAEAATFDAPETAAAVDAAVALPAGETSPHRVSAGEVIPRQGERRKASRVRGEQVRVQAELLDSLVNHSGEMNIYRARLEQQLSVYRYNLAELNQTINRVHEQLRQFEMETETQILNRVGRQAEDRHPDFDPLEMDRYSNLQQLSRSLVETIGDLHSIQELLDNTTRETESLLLQQSRVVTDLQEGLMRARMIPFAGLAPRLRRIVRQAAEELGKKVELTLDGAEGEMDRNVIERIVAPLEHMLRNAVDHGIEAPDVRREAGKPETGTISIAIHREGPEIVLQVADDGGGIDHAAIRARAIERGLIAADAQVSDSEVMQFVLQTGFSTAAKVTQISGRGVGMDVVNSEVKQLGGSLLIASTPGRGSIFTIRLPYTLAINQALLVKVGEDTFCIPLGTIEGVVRVDAEFLAQCYRSPGAAYRYAGRVYQLHHLGTLLNRVGMDPEGPQGRMPVLLVRIGEKRLALQVNALIGNREIVVKPLGPQLNRVPGVSGATILGDGRVILILDMAAVFRMAVRPQAPPVAAEAGAKGRLLVMVVDDSITVRKVTTRLLERYGFEVVTAKDGVDAMSLLQDRMPDVMLLDIEMPRMDGFELVRQVRNDDRLRHLPITMITSRTGDKHRERAMQMGVTHYLGKPFQEHELLKIIHRLIGIPLADGQEPGNAYAQV